MVVLGEVFAPVSGATDCVVRQGDWPFTPVEGDDATTSAMTFPELLFEARPVENVVPMGAPARLDLALSNMGSRSILVPPSIDLKGVRAGD